MVEEKKEMFTRSLWIKFRRIADARYLILSPLPFVCVVMRNPNRMAKRKLDENNFMGEILKVIL